MRIRDWSSAVGSSDLRERLWNAAELAETRKNATVAREYEIALPVELSADERRDSETQFRNGNRPELADKEAREIEMLMAYLPQQLTESEVVELVKQAVAERSEEGRVGTEGGSR